MTKDLEMDKLSWIIQVKAKCHHNHHKCPYKRKAEFLCLRGGNMKVETEIGMMRPQTKEC